MADGPLRGIRILDLTHVWAGPLSTRILADLGAEVIKIEAPTSRGPLVYPEPTPPLGGWIGGNPGDEPYNRNAYYVKLQRNKKSVAMDLKTTKGRNTFIELVKVADVVIENFSARAMPALGLNYERLATANPKISYVTMPGYGMSGPCRDWVAFGPSIESTCGFTNIMGYSENEPRNTATALIDPIEGTNAAAAVLSALRRRKDSDKGALVEMSLHEAGVSFCGPWLIEHQLNKNIQPIGNRHPAMAPHGVYPTAGSDEWIALACRNDADWRALCCVISELDPKANLSTRVQLQPSIDNIITNWTAKRRKEIATESLQAVGVPAGPLNTTPEMTADVQVQSRGFFVPLEKEGTPMPGNPVKMSGLSPADWTPCPRLGAENASILKDWLGFSKERINQLESDGVITERPPA